MTPTQAQKRYGAPGTATEGKYMVMYDVPSHLEIGVIPKKVYCNRDLVQPLQFALTNLVTRGFVHELRTWDGCYNVRKQRGSLFAQSMHSWGLAIDVNAAWNGLGKKPVLSSGFVKCFTDSGFEWGGTWSRPDGMHFQLK